RTQLLALRVHRPPTEKRSDRVRRVFLPLRDLAYLRLSPDGTANALWLSRVRRSRWTARSVASNPISERRTGVQAGKLERVGSLMPGKPIRAAAKRRRRAAVGSSR